MAGYFTHKFLFSEPSPPNDTARQLVLSHPTEEETGRGVTLEVCETWAKPGLQNLCSSPPFRSQLLPRRTSRLDCLPPGSQEVTRHPLTRHLFERLEPVEAWPWGCAPSFSALLLWLLPGLQPQWPFLPPEVAMLFCSGPGKGPAFGVEAAFPEARDPPALPFQDSHSTSDCGHFTEEETEERTPRSPRDELQRPWGNSGSEGIKTLLNFTQGIRIRISKTAASPQAEPGQRRASCEISS